MSGGESPLLAGLNEAQREAVLCTEGFIRVIAGAGSGKTRALARRFAHLVTDLGILPGSILCVTFTNRSANEMRRRIRRLTGDSDTGRIGTFHGFCVSVLQEDGHAIQLPRSFAVLDNDDIDDLLRIVYEERGLTLRDMSFARARDLIEARKTVQEPEYRLDLIAMSPEALRERYDAAVEPEDIVFLGCLLQQRKCFGLDYNDLIILSLHVFDVDADIRRKWQERLEYVMIDEFQDIDMLQWRLMRVLCGHHGNLFVVGDPDQTIYSWRGADARYLMDFESAFPGARTVMMNLNYRSTPQIIAAANSLISRNTARIRKDLVATRPDGPKPAWKHARSAAAEAGWIASRIAAMHKDGAPLRDVAILYRAHHLSRPVEEALLRRKIPYVIHGGIQFFARREIKDALAYLRMIAIRDDLSFLRVVNTPRRNIGRRRMAFLKERAEREGCSLHEALVRSADAEIFRGTRAAEFLALVEKFSRMAAHAAVSDLLAGILDESGYERMLRTEGARDRLDNLAELRQSVLEYEISCGEEAGLEHYLRHVAPFAVRGDDPDADRVRLMTVHAAKGLEFPHVFLCGLNEGIFPSQRVETLQGMEEERRLAFVALTRAERTLHLSGFGGRGDGGVPRHPSRFVLDIDQELLDVAWKPDADTLDDARLRIALSARALAGGDGAAAEEDGPGGLAVGCRVRHAAFGEGVVTGLDAERHAWIIRFDGMASERRLTFRAPLERI